jgi:hypothetical protein
MKKKKKKKKPDQILFPKSVFRFILSHQVVAAQTGN